MDDNNCDFSLIIRNSSNNIYQLLLYSFVDCIGNPNVYDIRDELNTLLNGYISVSNDFVDN